MMLKDRAEDALASKKRYVALLRGINVGGKNKVGMAALKTMLEELGLEDVKTYIQSGNAIFRSALAAETLARKIERQLVADFKLDDELIKVLVITDEQLRSVVENRPRGFGSKPDTYHSDAIFLMDIDASEAFAVFKPRDGVDQVWEGSGVIYSQRVSAERTKSRLSKITASPLYKSMTIRSWATTEKLLKLLEETGKDAG